MSSNPNGGSKNFGTGDLVGSGQVFSAGNTMNLKPTPPDPNVRPDLAHLDEQPSTRSIEDEVVEWIYLNADIVQAQPGLLAIAVRSLPSREIRQKLTKHFGSNTFGGIKVVFYNSSMFVEHPDLPPLLPLAVDIVDGEPPDDGSITGQIAKSGD